MLDNRLLYIDNNMVFKTRQLKRVKVTLSLSLLSFASVECLTSWGNTSKGKLNVFVSWIKKLKIFQMTLIWFWNRQMSQIHAIICVQLSLYIKVPFKLKVINLNVDMIR